MRFLADECCPAPVVNALRNAGHDVANALETLRGASDADLAALAAQEARILITEDYDFGEMVVRRGLRLPALVIRFLDQVSSAERPGRVLEVMEELGDRLEGQLTIVDSRRIRRRPL